jgi:hypothetical protein
VLRDGEDVATGKADKLYGSLVSRGDSEGAGQKTPTAAARAVADAPQDGSQDTEAQDRLKSADTTLHTVFDDGVAADDDPDVGERTAAPSNLADAPSSDGSARTRADAAIDTTDGHTSIEPGGLGSPTRSDDVGDTPTIPGRWSGELMPVPKEDAAADALRERIGGQSRVKFSTDPSGREFDVVSDEYIAQTKSAKAMVNRSFRAQAKATLEAAKATGRAVYYHFEGAPPAETRSRLEHYSERYGVRLTYDDRSPKD